MSRSTRSTPLLYVVRQLFGFGPTAVYVRGTWPLAVRLQACLYLPDTPYVLSGVILWCTCPIACDSQGFTGWTPLVVDVNKPI